MFIQVPTDTPLLPVADTIARTILEKLQSGQPVLWLLSGGSCIAVAAEVATRLQGTPLHGLTVSLIDERYGPDGHAHSNWQQLQEAGFRLESATLVPVLSGKSLHDTSARFQQFLTTQLDSAPYILGLFGVGSDGHTAGILPHSSAVTAVEFVHTYDGGEHQRITTTFPFLKKLDEAVVYMVGEAKREVLEQLQQTTDLDTQPAQVLKQIKKLTIFNDYKGDKQ